MSWLSSSGVKLVFSSVKTAVDDYAKDGGPGEVRLLCSFYHESLRTWIKTIVNKFAISNHTALYQACTLSEAI